MHIFQSFTSENFLKTFCIALSYLPKDSSFLFLEDFESSSESRFPLRPMSARRKLQAKEKVRPPGRFYRFSALIFPFYARF